MSNHEAPNDEEKEIEVEEGSTVMQSEAGSTYAENRGEVLSESEIRERQKSGEIDGWREQS